VGTPGRNQFNEIAAVFLSADGMLWRSVPVDDGVGRQDTSELTGVAVGPLGLIAYGGVCCGSEEPAMWVSDDGVAWMRVRIAGDFDPRTSYVARVVGHATGWVAVGTTGDRAAMWTSADGRTWTAVDPVGAGLGRGTVSDVALSGDQLVAVGTIDDAAGTHDGAIWMSRDGENWLRVAEADPSLTGPDETELVRVVSHAGGLFIVGNHGSHQERVRCEQLVGGLATLVSLGPPETALSCGWGREHHWVSRDGINWTRLQPLDPLPGQPAAPGARPIEFRVLAAGGPGLVNLAEDTVPPESDARIWISGDGDAWRPLDPAFPAPVGTLQNGVAVIGGTIVAVGEKTALGQGVGVAIGAVH
jgi:hypothetical protein